MAKKYVEIPQPEAAYFFLMLSEITQFNFHPLIKKRKTQVCRNKEDNKYDTSILVLLWNLKTVFFFFL